MKPSVTLLNAMASPDFGQSLTLQRSWGAEWLDLKDGIFGKSLLDLSDEEAERAQRSVQEQGLKVYCLSSPLFDDELEKGEAHFLDRHLGRVQRLLELAKIFQPVWVRLLAAHTRRRAEISDAVAYVQSEHPWLFSQYREAVDRIALGGQHAILENEVKGCILSTPGEVLDFFRAVDRPEKLFFTFDVGNLWQEGTFPSVEHVRKLAPLTRYLHLKGGRALDGGSKMTRRSSLEESSWPVKSIIDAYLAAGSGQVICINPPHGSSPPGEGSPSFAKRDFDFVQAHVANFKG